MPINLLQDSAEVQTFQQKRFSCSRCPQWQASDRTPNVGNCALLERKTLGTDPGHLDCPYGQSDFSRREPRQENRIDRILRLVARLSPQEKQQLFEQLKQQGDFACPEPEQEDFLTGNPAGIETRINCGRLEQRDREDQGRFEYWFHYEVWNQGKRTSRSRYLTSHAKDKSISRSGAAKIAMVEQQIANDRPYGETLELLGKPARKGGKS